MWVRRCAAVLLVLSTCTIGAAQERLPVDPQTGLVIDTHWELVRAHCSGCHSIRLVTQNRMGATGWRETIRWMQDKHNLWDLGANEPKIVAYLETHYGVPEVPLRRRPLNQVPIETEELKP